MGEPRRFRKKYENPLKPWDRDLLMEELILVGEYGLKSKKELRRTATFLRKIRDVARSTYGMPSEERELVSEELLGRLYKLGVLPENSAIDDVLKLTVRDILERRLQTIVYKKGLAKSIYHSRQMIVHRHIKVDGRVVDRPGYLISRDEEAAVEISQNSPYSNPDHPMWKSQVEEE